MALCKYQQGDPYTSIKVLCTQLGGSTQFSPVAKCSQMRICLPTFRPKQELYDKWLEEFQPESQIFTVCRYCPKFAPL